MSAPPVMLVRHHVTVRIRCLHGFSPSVAVLLRVLCTDLACDWTHCSNVRRTVHVGLGTYRVLRIARCHLFNLVFRIFDGIVSGVRGAAASMYVATARRNRPSSLFTASLIASVASSSGTAALGV